MHVLRQQGGSRLRSAGLAAVLIAVGIGAVEAAQGTAQTPAQGAPPTIVLGRRAADDATELARVICADIEAATDLAASQAPGKKLREMTTAVRVSVADAEEARAAALEEMLASKVVRQDMLEKLRRAADAQLNVRARRYAIQAVQNLVEPCATARRAALDATAPTVPTANEAAMGAALESSVLRLVTSFRRLEDNLVLMDQALRLRASHGSLTMTQADAVLREWATALALRDLSRGPDPEIVAAYRAEAGAFLQGVQKAIGTATKWPDDRPAAEYAALAKGLLQLVSELFTADFARGFAPTSELVEGQIVLAWTQGNRDVPPASDLFADQYDRLLRAIASAMPALPLPRPATADKTCHGFAGTWTTNYGDVVLAVNGDQVTGENASYRATINGRLNGQTLQGTRSIAGFPDVAIKFTLATDGSKFEGTVDLAPGHSIAWNGTCG